MAFKTAMLTLLLVLNIICRIECSLFDSESSNAIYNDTIGDITVQEQSSIIPPDRQGLSLITHYKFPRKGWVHTISYRTPLDMLLNNTTPVYLQAWRFVSDQRYELISSTPHITITRGIQTVSNLRMFVQEGDFLGFSCRPTCNIVKDESVMDMNRIRFGKSGDRFVVTNQFDFTNPALSARIPMSATIEVNSPQIISANTLPVETTPEVDSVTERSPTERSPTQPTPKITTKPSTVPTVPIVPTTQRTSDGMDQNLWVAIVIIVSVLLLVIFVLVIVCVCTNRCRTAQKEAKYRQYKNSSRPGSRPNSMIDPDFSSTLGRNPNARGMMQTNEMVISNETRQPQTSVVLVTPKPLPHAAADSSDNSTLRVAFDTGQVYENGDPVARPPPPIQPPPST